MTTVKTHPLAEIIAKKLFSIETVPVAEQKNMVRRAIKAACEYHDMVVSSMEYESSSENIFK